MHVQRVKAKVTYQPAPVTTRRELLIIDPARLRIDDDYRYTLIDQLCEDNGKSESSDDDAEVGCSAACLRAGVRARKPTGNTWYTRVDTTWLYKQLQVTDGRVLCIGDYGNMQLWNPDDVVIVKLRDICNVDFLHELSEIRCPK